MVEMPEGQKAVVEKWLLTVMNEIIVAARFQNSKPRMALLAAAIRVTVAAAAVAAAEIHYV